MLVVAPQFNSAEKTVKMKCLIEPGSEAMLSQVE